MDGKGRWLDNVFVERLWRSLKYEEVYLQAYEGVAEAGARSAATSPILTAEDGTPASTAKPGTKYSSRLAASPQQHDHGDPTSPFKQEILP